jgi:hypothetical protein
VLRSLIDFGYGVLICWFLNLVQLGIALLLLATTEKALPAVYVLTIALALVQIGYVVPTYRLLCRKGKRQTAYGLLTAACLTALVNAGLDYYLFGPRVFHLWS